MLDVAVRAKISYRQHVFAWVPLYLLLFAVGLPLLVWQLATFPVIWFDEGYNAQVARTLAERGIYGTYTINGYHLFDPAVSTGPSVIMPVALSFRLFGPGVIQARGVVVLFALVALASLLSLATYMYGRRPAWWITLAILAIPAAQDIDFFLVGRQVLGEIPSLAFILLGLRLWFRSWEDNGWQSSTAAGLLFGLGLLAKFQLAFALLPTLLIIAGGRNYSTRSRSVRWFLPVLLAAGVVASWMVVQRIQTLPNQQRENSNLLIESIRVHVITDLFGRNLTRSGLIVSAAIVLIVLASVWSLWHDVPETHRFTNGQWAVATLIVFVACSVVWFVLLSIGWTRYIFVGWILSLLLFGKVILQVWLWFRRRFTADSVLLRSLYYPSLVALGALIILAHASPIVQSEPDTSAQQMADYIRTNIPKAAVIESWEWQLDALSSHWEYHHPDQRYLLLAISQRAHDQRRFNLDYDIVQADPNFLIVGPFGVWTEIYDAQAISTHFQTLTIIGPYHIYSRVR